MIDHLNKSKSPINNRTLFEGDNLNLLRSIESDCVDLIYLDPPFNSNTNYLFAGKGFGDTWTDTKLSKYHYIELIKSNKKLANFIALSETLHSVTMSSYLSYLSVRLIQMHRILKTSGSIALHCDDNASHYLKICLDFIFGRENFPKRYQYTLS